MKPIPPHLVFNHDDSVTLLGEIPQNNNKKQIILLSLKSAVKNKGTSSLHTEDIDDNKKTSQKIYKIE